MANVPTNSGKTHYKMQKTSTIITRSSYQVYNESLELTKFNLAHPVFVFE